MNSNDDQNRNLDLPATFAPNGLSLNDERGGEIYKAEPATASEAVARRGFQFRSFPCPICNAKISITRAQAGRQVVCPDCETTVTAPTDLDFEAETEYERANFNREKKRRDELFSPIRNPLREGINLDEREVYGVDSERGGEGYKTVSRTGARRGFQYRSFLCPVCQTQISITRAQAGRHVVCPDCGTTTTAPTNLNFDSETEYEQANFDHEKKRRDELFSPIRNPNREGIKVDAKDVYGVDSGGVVPQSPRVPKETVKYVPARCRVCETFIQVPESQIGKTITCPDCGSKFEVTAVLKAQKDVIDVKFAPRDRGTYDIGAIPEQRGATIRMANGGLMELDPKDKFVDSSGVLNKAFQRAKRAREQGESLAQEFNGEENPSVPQIPVPKWNIAPTPPTADAKLSTKKTKKKRPTDDERGAARVLRKRDGELYWALPSPPRPFPLFNRTFAVVCGSEFWKRVLILELMLATCYTVALMCALISRGFLYVVFYILMFLVALPLVLATLAPQWALYFRALCDAGATGRRRISEWAEDVSFWDGALTAIYYVATSTIATVVLPLIAIFCESKLFPDSEFTDVYILPISVVSSSVFFPIFLLSAKLSGNWYMILHKYALRTLITKFHIWCQLFLATALLIYVPPTIWNLLFDAESPFILGETFLAVPLTGFYALLLGRMSWIIEDEYRSATYDEED